MKRAAIVSVSFCCVTDQTRPTQVARNSNHVLSHSSAGGQAGLVQPGQRVSAPYGVSGAHIGTCSQLGVLKPCDRLVEGWTASPTGLLLMALLTGVTGYGLLATQQANPG